MSFGKFPKKVSYNHKNFLTVYFTIGLIGIVILYIYFAERFQKEATIEAKAVPDLISQFMYYSGYENFENILVQYVFYEIIANINYPIIYTNAEHEPIFWKNIHIDENESWDELNESQQKSIQKRIKKMRNKNHVIPLLHMEDRTVLGYTYYEDSDMVKRLKYLPYIEISFFVIFVLYGLYAQSTVKKYEKNLIWIGLAKETAHQFGTPISSIMGWLDVLKIKLENNPAQDELTPMLDDMFTDVELLKKVVSRFGKVGSQVSLQPANISTVIEDRIEYFQKRSPHFDHEIRFSYTPKDKNIQLLLDVELLQWAFENLFKNCIDAMTDKGGDIHIFTFLTDNKFHIQIKDSGMGIPKSMFKKIFEPGVTRKSRGWGLGLSLTKRIIEEYHNGKIYVLDSSLSEGTIIEIVLPCHLLSSP